MASYLGLPDAGIATYRDMVERIGQIARMTKTPIIADADTGYGGLLNVSHTVRGYEQAGVTAIQLEDQEFPKKCGHTPNRRVVPLEDMVQKIQVACDSRSSADFLIIARTDSRTGLGLDEALRRGEAYARAGADIVFVEAPESEQEMVTIARRIEAPVMANLVNGGRTPMLPAKRLAEIGFAVAIFPAVAFCRPRRRWKMPIPIFATTAPPPAARRCIPLDQFNRMIGFPDVWEFEKRYGL